MPRLLRNDEKDVFQSWWLTYVVAGGKKKVCIIYAEQTNLIIIVMGPTLSTLKKNVDYGGNFNYNKIIVLITTIIRVIVLVVQRV